MKTLMFLLIALGTTGCMTSKPVAPPDPGPAAWVERREPDPSLLAKLDRLQTETDRAGVALDESQRRADALETSNRTLRTDLVAAKTETAQVRSSLDAMTRRIAVLTDRVLRSQLDEARLRRRILEVVDAETKESEVTPTMLEQRLVAILLGELAPVPIDDDSTEAESRR